MAQSWKLGSSARAPLAARAIATATRTPRSLRVIAHLRILVRTAPGPVPAAILGQAARGVSRPEHTGVTDSAVAATIPAWPRAAPCAPGRRAGRVPDRSRPPAARVAAG